MANTLKFGKGTWATKTGSSMAYNDQNGNYKPLPFNVERDSIATRVNKQGLIEVVGKDKLRIDYKDSAKGVALLEPSRTNNLLRSEEFDNASWTKFSSGTGIAPVVTANYTTSPDGSNNADRVVFDKGSGTSGSDFSQMRQIVSDVGQGVSSVYIKSNTSDSYTMGIDPVGNATLITITPEWQRFTYSETTNDRLTIGLRASQTSNYADVSIWGAQMEAGSYATSIINTKGSAVTRLADACSGAGNEQVINSTEGVLYYEAKVKTDDIFAANCIAVSDGTDTNRLSIIMYGNINSIRASMNVGGVSQFDFNLPSGYIQEQYYKIAVSYKVNDCKIFINGTKISTDTSATMPSLATFDRLSFDLGQGSYDFYGNIKDVRVYNTALTDAELIALTT